MILVDTSIWVDHLRHGNPTMEELLTNGAVLSHPWIRGELALGSLANRLEILVLLGALPQAAVATPDEVVDLISAEKLHGSGIGFVDAQLLAATRLTPGATLWSRDKRLASAAHRLNVAASL